MITDLIWTFETPLTLEINRNPEFQGTFQPVMLVTFILSVYIAINFDYREAFFNEFEGKNIPSITAFVLENFKPGSVTKEFKVEKFKIGKEYSVTQQGFGCALTFLDCSYFETPLGRRKIVEWFYRLARHNQKGDLFASTELTQATLERARCPIGLSVEAQDIDQQLDQQLDQLDPYRRHEETPSKGKCYWIKDSELASSKNRDVWLIIATALQLRLTTIPSDQPIESSEQASSCLAEQDTNFTDVELSKKLGKFIQWDCHEFLSTSNPELN